MHRVDRRLTQVISGLQHLTHVPFCDLGRQLYLPSCDDQSQVVYAARQPISPRGGAVNWGLRRGAERRDSTRWCDRRPAVKAAAVWLRVSTGHQDSDNQVPDVERFTGPTSSACSPA